GTVIAAGTRSDRCGRHHRCGATHCDPRRRRVTIVPQRSSPDDRHARAPGNFSPRGIDGGGSMRTLDNHGVTLVELLLTLVMAVAFAVAAHQVVRMAATSARTAALHGGATRDAVTVWALANHDLRAASAIDLASPDSRTLDLSRPVGEGSVCAATTDAVRLRW